MQKTIEFITNNHDYVFQLLLGFFILIFGILFNNKINKIKENGICTNGEIIDFVKEINYTEDSLNRFLYYPIIRFKDLKGNSIERKAEIGTSIKSSKTLPYNTKIYYKQNGTNYEIIIENKIIDYLSAFVIITGLAIILFFTYNFLNIKL
ncbi:hypothetical protein FNW25_04380 [Flavobacterium franklandianum]|uniref:hypothetical protein n=1 Tax=Flavobacterium franklandianum TaxID=2594430 RepID=UPI001179B141|nr:hypothetical protein [Flavobacterium franklandianum]TRX28633.1 hypothetical protein FNW25_04380 [Flavobacterium franklandianum]